MEIDDSSDKIRRNLLIFSFAIVVSSFLNLSIQKQGKIFSTFDLSTVSPLKFWFVIISVLIYLFYRYWFDVNTEKAIQFFKSEYGSKKYSIITKLLNKDIEKSFYQNEKTKFVKEFEELNNSHVVENNKQYGIPIMVKSAAYPNLSEGEGWKGKIGNSYSINWTGTSYQLSGGGNYTFEIPPFKRIFVQSILMLKIVIYSKSISELVTPIILFIFALLICLYKLAITYSIVEYSNLCWI